MSEKQRVYLFGGEKSEGNTTMKNLLGGKGANLAEMASIGVPVPPGFTITTEVCAEYNEFGLNGTVELIKAEIEKAVKYVESLTGTKFGDSENPLLLSVRSGARASMPGMMDTVLNLGLNEAAVEGIAKKSGNERFAWDSYRRFVQMYGDVVLDMKPESKEDIDPFEEILEQAKKAKGVESDTELSIDDLKDIVEKFKAAVLLKTEKTFPTDPWEQLWGAVMAVFGSWNNDRAILYRRLNNIPGEWGTAVNVQAMVFGNMGENSATGVAFTRDAGTGENLFNGEYLIDAQGEDVVAGTRTPQQITKIGSERWAKLAEVTEEDRAKNFPSLEEAMPELYKQLFDVQVKLEQHYKDMQDLEFTIQDGKLWLLQTRTGKRTGAAMVKIAVDMLKEGMIDEKETILRQEPNKLDELLHPVFDTESLEKAELLAKGLPASPGAASGQVVFFADEAENWKQDGKEVILVRIETSPEDLAGMDAANGILTARGGMTSHAAVVARGMGKCCVSGVGTLDINYKTRTIKVAGKTIKEGDWISLNGTTGQVLDGEVATMEATLGGDFAELMELAEKHSRMYVRTNADTPKDAKKARYFGAKGIGLTRTEHMFFDAERLESMRKMILAPDEAGRRKALEDLLPYQREDFEGIFEAMQDLPVTVRLLDPPLHEFLPNAMELKDELANLKFELLVDSEDLDEVDETIAKINDKQTLLKIVESLHEVNPMLGHRGCRLGNTYPEITEMQTRAIIEAALNLKAKGINAHPEIMVPLIGTVNEYKMQEKIVRATANKVFAEYGDTIEYLVGTMIEIPRAALTANLVAEHAEFFSFGTNDLTQMTFGYSRDDIGNFLPIYLDKGIIPVDPFQVIDFEGVGQLVEMGTKKGRSVNPKLKVGICGEHGGEPASVEFCDGVGMDYVSCSPFRVPIARLAAAQATLKAQK